MELHQLRYFAKVAELGHFTHAAEMCHVSQPSLSQAIAKLERELGQPLFERLGRKVQLTRAGEEFRDRTKQILVLLDEAKGSLRDESDSGSLSLAAIPTVAPYFLPQILGRFAAECPRATIEVIEEPTAKILELLAQGQLDLAILALPLPTAGLEVTELLTEELLAVLPSHHPLVEKPRLSLKDLANERFVLLSEAHCLTGAALSFCSRKNVVPVATSRLQQLTTVLELVRLGQGVSLVPAMVAATDEHSGRVYRHLSGEKPTRTLAMARNPNRFRTKLAERFAEFLRVDG